MYIWLKPGAEEKLAQIYPNLRIKSDDTGNKYIDVSPYVPLGRAAQIPKIPYRLIKLVTLVDTIVTRYVADGVYIHKRARLVAKTWGTPGQQTLNINAPNLRQAEEIYTLVRQHRIDPTTSWGPQTQTSTDEMVDALLEKRDRYS